MNSIGSTKREEEHLYLSKMATHQRKLPNPEIDLETIGHCLIKLKIEGKGLYSRITLSSTKHKSKGVP